MTWEPEAYFDSGNKWKYNLQSSRLILIVNLQMCLPYLTVIGVHGILVH